MNAKRITTHLSSVALLLTWGGVILYFHLSGRMAAYLPQTGGFRPMALYAAMALIGMGLFNLATLGADDEAPAKPEGDGKDHQHGKEGTCCGCQTAATADDSTSGSGRWLAMVILAVPLLVAAVFSPDRFSPAAIIKKGAYAKYDTSKAPPPNSRLVKASPKTDAPAAAKAPTSTAPVPQSMPPASPGTVAVTPSAGPRVPGSAAPATSSVVVTTLPPATTTTTAASGSTPPGGTPPAAAAVAAAPAKSYGSFTLDDLKAQVPMSKEGNFILEVPELYYTAGDKEVQGVLAGQNVETVAQVLPEKVNNTEGKRLRVFRLLVQCCASDARPYSVPVEFADKAPDLKEMSWVKLVGKMAYRQEGGQTVPLIEAKSITPTTAPENSMLY